METWQDVTGIIAVVALALALCSDVKAVCLKIRKREGLE